MCRFWGAPKTRFVYDTKEYTIPDNGVLTIVADSDPTCASQPESKVLYMAGNSQTTYGVVNKVFMPKDIYWERF